MSKPYFRSAQGKVPRPGAVNHAAALDVPRRVAALEQGAGHRLAPSSYAAAIYVANSGSPTHNSSGSFQKVSAGGGTATYTAAYDYYPTGGTAQADTTNKRINIQRAGLYLVTACIRFSAITDAKSVGVAVYQTGSARLQQLQSTGATAAIHINVTGLIDCVSGDYLELYAYQNDSASEAYDTAGANYNRLTATLIGPPA